MMRVSRRIVCVAAALFPLVAIGVAGLGAATGPEAEARDFRAVLDEAAEAYDRGDAEAAHAKLREAGLMVADDEFHQMLYEAATRYEAGKPQAARALLKKATRYLNPWFWLILGFVAQAMFVGRFAVQWIASERRGESVIPIAFWYLSLLGSWGLLSYAIWRQDAVIICGQAFNSIIYVRNLMLIHRKRRQLAAAGEEASE